MSKAEKEAAVQRLRDHVEPGDTVHTILRHVSGSGMTRAISVVIISTDGPTAQHEPWDISYLVARADDSKIDQRHGGIRVRGAGMDMGFDLVYRLSRYLFPDGFDCIGEGCPANDHSNSPYPERVAGSMHHRDGGYALRQRWL